MRFELNPFFQALVTVISMMGIVFFLFGPGPVDNINISDHRADVILDNPDSKIYVAVEGEAKISVIDPIRRSVLRNIDLAGFSPHNVQVSPDNKSAWVTGNSAVHSHSILSIESANADTGGTADEVIVIDPLKDSIVKRISIKPGIHLAHVSISPDSKFAY